MKTKSLLDLPSGFQTIVPALALLAAGCSPSYTLTTVALLRDPARASLRASADPRSTLLPEGRVPARVTVAEGWLTLGVEPRTRAPYTIAAVREADGALMFDDGYRHDIMSSDGTVRALKNDQIPPIALHEPQALIPMCADAEAPYGRVRNSYGDCLRDAKFRGYLATSWDNVAEIRQIRRPAEYLGLIEAFVLVGGLVSGVGGAILVGEGASERRGEPSRVPLLVSGSLLLAVPAALFAAIAPAAFAPERTEVVFPPPAPR
jgi:hypothetical protein